MPRPANPRPPPAVPATAPMAIPATSNIPRSPDSRPTTSRGNSRCSSRPSATTPSCSVLQPACPNRTCTTSARISRPNRLPRATATRRSRRAANSCGASVMRPEAFRPACPAMVRQAAAIRVRLPADRRSVDRLSRRQAQGLAERDNLGQRRAQQDHAADRQAPVRTGCGRGRFVCRRPAHGQAGDDSQHQVRSVVRPTLEHPTLSAPFGVNSPRPGVSVPISRPGAAQAAYAPGA